ncbi:hypothetical protein ACFLZZ_04760 [Nanoarchaeota archaeon]
MSDLPLAEITLRKYETPYNLGRRELIKKICLSFGLLQPGDSRDVIVDIFLVLLNSKNDRKSLDLDSIKTKVKESRKAASCEEKGVADSNIRRQLRRLKDLMIVESSENKYRIAEFESLEKLFEDKINNFLLPSIVSRVKEYLKELEKN